MLGQPLSMLVPPVVGLRLSGELPEGHDRHRPRAHRHRAAAPATASSASSSSATARAWRHAAREPGDHRQHVARVRLDVTIFPIDDETLHYLRFTGPTESSARSSRPTPRSRACGTTDGAEPATPSTRARPVDRRAQPRRPVAAPGPGAAAPRPRRCSPRRWPVAARGRAPRPCRPRRPQPTCAWRTARSSPSSTAHVVIAAITSCTNTSNPQVMVGRRPAGRKSAVELGLRSKPWVKTTLAPGSRVVMDYLERAGLVPLSRASSASISSASAARRASATPAAAGRRSRTPSTTTTWPCVVGALGQPQLRGPDPPRRPHELPRLAAARGRLRPGRHDGHRPRHRAPRHRPPTASRSTCATSGRAPHEVAEVVEQAVGAGDVPPRATPTSSTATRRWRIARGTRRGHATPGTTRSTYVRRAAVLRGHADRRRRRRRHLGRARARRARRQRHDRPHLARRLDPSRPARPAASCIEHGVPRRRLQLLRRPPRQPRGHDPRHLRQRPPAQPARARDRGRRHRAPARRRAR